MVPPWVTASCFLVGNWEAELKPLTFSSLLLFHFFLSFLFSQPPQLYSTFDCCLLWLLLNNNNNFSYPSEGSTLNNISLSPPLPFRKTPYPVSCTPTCVTHKLSFIQFITEYSYQSYSSPFFLHAQTNRYRFSRSFHSST